MPNPLYTCMSNIGFRSVAFYGISTIVGYILPNLFIHIYWIYTTWFRLLLWHINDCWLFNAKSSLCIFIKYMISFVCVLWPKYMICKHIFIYLHSPSAWEGWDTRSVFQQSLRDFSSEFSFQTSCVMKAIEPSLPYILPIAREGIIGFMPFLRVLVQCEMQSVSFRIWTRVTVSISNDDNHYTTFIPKHILLIHTAKWSNSSISNNQI